MLLPERLPPDLKSAVRRYTRTTDKAYNAEFTKKLKALMPEWLPKKRKPLGYWTKDLCALEAKKYNTRKDFETHSGSAYSGAWQHGWLDEICAHMKAGPSEIRARQASLVAFAEKYGCAKLREVDLEGYRYAVRSKLLRHLVLPSLQNPNAGLTRERCVEILATVGSRVGLRSKDRKVYRHILRRGWTDLFPPKDNKKDRKWSFEAVSRAAAEYKSSADLRRQNFKAYSAASRKGWLRKLFTNVRKKKAA